MDFDTAWCPACDRQIQPKRYLVNVPTATPAPQPPLRKGGLVSGTGRLRALKAQQAAAAAAAAANTKQRLVIDNGPIPLYCSDACHLADINDRATDETKSATTSAKSKKSKKTASTVSSSASSSSSSSLSTPPKPLSSMEKFANAYNFSIPPPPPTMDSPTSSTYSPHQNTNGIMMAGKLISELCPTKPAGKQQRYPHSPPEPTKVTPGWNDGTGAWRSAVYNFTSAPSGQQTLLSRTQSAQPPRIKTRTPSSSGPASAPSYPSALESSELIAQFNDKFTKRCEARMTTSSSTTATPTGTPTPASPPRERSLLASGAQGKLLVPDVKLKVRTGSSSSLTSTRSRTPLSAPATTTTSVTGTSSRKSVRSPLSATHSHSDEDERYSTSFTLRRPTIETRSWSYDNVPTYPIMQLPPTKITRLERRVIEGVEQDVEVQVEVREERKRLFLFAPTTVCRV